MFERGMGVNPSARIFDDRFFVKIGETIPRPVFTRIVLPVIVVGVGVTLFIGLDIDAAVAVVIAAEEVSRQQDAEYGTIELFREREDDE